MPSKQTGGAAQSKEMVTGDSKSRGVIQAKFSDYGWPAGVHTLQFDVSADEPSAEQAKSALRCEAVITWTVNGHTVTRRIGVTNGAAISGVAEAVNVQLFDVTQEKDVPPATSLGRKYNVSALVTPGERGIFQNPPTLEANSADIQEIGPGAGFLDFQVPQDAGAIAVYVAIADIAHNAIADGQVSVTQAVGSAGAPVAEKIYNPRDFQWVPLAPGCIFVRVVNGGAAAAGKTIAVQVVWGIEG